jgi:outer membrane protein OmpA-like peptidoglycan-associated protein
MNTYFKFLPIKILMLLNIFTSYGQEVFSLSSLDTLLLKNYKINTILSQTLSDNLGGYVHNDTLYFSSNRKIRSAKQYINKDGTSLYNIYKAPLSSLDEFNQTLLNGLINTKLNESLPVFTKNGTTMYYTGNYEEQGVAYKNLNILRASKKNGVWGNVTYLSLNSKEHSNGQAVLNDSETKLYFVSDRDTIGEIRNIYVAELLKEGGFSEPQKLGNNINTSAHEIAPFISKNNGLYFSSNRAGGYGGFDVFYADLNDKNAQPINLGSAINSAADDFYFSIDEKSSNGFLTSNREGKLKIYSVVERESIELIIEKLKKEQIAFKQDKTYQITLQENKISSPVKLSFVPGKRELNKEGLAFLQYLIRYIRKQPAVILDINALIDGNTISSQLLNKRINYVVEEINKITKYANNFKIVSKKGTRLQSALTEGIAFYFDYNSSYLNKINKAQLITIAKHLEADATLRAVFFVNSDSRGTNAYNMWLSKRRLQTVKKFYKTLGIPSNKIIGAAYGEEVLLNKCTNDAKCAEQTHKLNRRVGYKIIKQNSFLKLKD